MSFRLPRYVDQSWRARAQTTGGGNDGQTNDVVFVLAAFVVVRRALPPPVCLSRDEGRSTRTGGRGNGATAT